MSVNKIDDEKFVKTYEEFSKILKKVSLLSKKELNQINSLGENFLHFAVMDRNIKLIKELLKCGIDIDKVDNCGETPLSTAVVIGDEFVVKALIGAGANIKKRYYLGNTLLHIAKENHYNDIYNLLINFDPALKNIKNELGEFPDDIDCCNKEV